MLAAPPGYNAAVLTAIPSIIRPVVAKTLVALLVALCVGACTASKSRVEQGAEQGILHFANEAEPKGLDPHLITGLLEQRVLVSVLEGLVGLDHDLNVIPGVAHSWDVSDDRETYTFHLRPEAKWSDGSPLTAHDFVWSWRRILNPKLGAPYAYLLYVIENAEPYHKGDITDPEAIGVTAIDDHTLEVTLESPTPYFLSLQIHFTYLPVPRQAITAHGGPTDRTNPWTQPGNFLANGPFVLERWAPNEVIAVRKNPHYWDAENVQLNGIHFYPINDRNTEERMFRVGDLHLTSNVPPTKLDHYRENRPDDLLIAPVYGTYFYRFNIESSPLQDKLVRKALAMSINRQVICDMILRGGQKPADAFTPPDPNGYTPRASIPYDPERARELLAEAGYANGAEMPPVEILYNTDDVHREVAESIQAMWKDELGVDARLLNQEWKVYLRSMDQLDYSVARSSWFGDVLDPINFLECFTTGNGNNRTGWSNEEFDGLIAAAREEPDADDRAELLQQAEDILLDEAPIAPVYTFVTTQLRSAEVKGYKPNLLAHYSWKNIHLEPTGD